MRPVVVGVGIRDDGESGEEVLGAEDGAGLHPVLRVPDGEAVAEEVLGRAGDPEVDLQLPVAHQHGLERREKNKLKTCQLVKFPGFGSEIWLLRERP